MCCLCNDICKWVDILVFLDKDSKPKARSPASSLYWLAGDVKEPTHLLQRVGHEVPGVVVWPCYVISGVQLNMAIEFFFAVTCLKFIFIFKKLIQIVDPRCKGD